MDNEQADSRSFFPLDADAARSPVLLLQLMIGHAGAGTRGSRADKPERAQAVGRYNVTLAQFFQQVFAAAEAAGAAAILPYKFIPYSYKYNRTLYEFGTNTAAYKCSVAAMYQHQEQRVNPVPVCSARHSAPCAPVTCHQGLIIGLHGRAVRAPPF